jgi:hypothetical protein
VSKSSKKTSKTAARTKRKPRDSSSGSNGWSLHTPAPSDHSSTGSARPNGKPARPNGKPARPNGKPARPVANSKGTRAKIRNNHKEVFNGESRVVAGVATNSTKAMALVSEISIVSSETALPAGDQRRPPRIGESLVVAERIELSENQRLALQYPWWTWTTFGKEAARSGLKGKTPIGWLYKAVFSLLRTRRIRTRRQSYLYDADRIINNELHRRMGISYGKPNIYESRSDNRDLAISIAIECEASDFVPPRREQLTALIRVLMSGHKLPAGNTKTEEADRDQIVASILRDDPQDPSAGGNHLSLNGELPDIESLAAYLLTWPKHPNHTLAKESFAEFYVVHLREKRPVEQVQGVILALAEKLGQQLKDIGLQIPAGKYEH